MMRPEEIALALLRRWWIIVIAALAAAGIAYVGTARQPETYTVSTRLMAIAEPADYWLDLYAKNRLASYKNLMGTEDFVRQALRDAGSDIDPELAQRKLMLNHYPEPNIIHLVVTDSDPERAATIVNAIADAYVKRSAEDNAELAALPRPEDAPPPALVHMIKLDEAEPPTDPDEPRVRINALAGGVLGAVAGLMIAFGLLYFDDTLKKPVDLERYMGLPVLATLPEDALESQATGVRSPERQLARRVTS